MERSMQKEMDLLVAQTAESVEGAACIIDDLIEDADLERSVRARMYTLRDALCSCAGRVDAVADLMEASGC